MSEDDDILRDLWTATVPAFQQVKNLDFSSSFVDTAADVVQVDAERKAQRRSEIPTTIIAALIFYSLVAAGVLGGVMKTRRGQQFGIALLTLNMFVLMLVADINRPVGGTIHESQEPMQRMLARLKANPPAVYQRLVEVPGQQAGAPASTGPQAR